MATDYEIPHFAASESRRHGYCLEKVAEGQAWLEAQKPTKDWPDAMEVLSAPGGGDKVAGQSNVGYNKVKRSARELVASLTSFKHEGEFISLWDQKLFDTAQMLTNLDRNWYRNPEVGAAHRGGMQYAVATGTSYWLETWNPHFHSRNRGDIQLQPLSPQDVTFIQLPRDHDIQRAYAVIWREELPINLARQIYGRTNKAFADSLVPDRDAPTWIGKGLALVQKFLSPALRVAGVRSGTQQNTASFPTVDIFHMYTLDSSTNDGPIPIRMGARGTNWSYVVPALGDPIPLKEVNPATGQPFTRPATEEDCVLFPLRRYTIFSRSGICYDGSSSWWHGDVPITRIRFSDWAWEALGQSLLSDSVSMQDGIIALMRGVEDSMACQLDPPYIFDDTLVASSWAGPNGFNPRKAGSRAAAPLSMGDPIKFPVDLQAYNVSPIILDYISQQEERIDHQMGVKDLVAIAKAKQIPSADTLEKLMEMAGPIVEDMVKAIEVPMTQLGKWRLSYYLQFYTRGRMIKEVGPDGVPLLDTAGNQKWIEFKPERLVPYQVGETSESRNTRAIQLIEQFAYDITESGMNEIRRMSTKLLYLQMMKAGFPISWWTMAKVCSIPNFGPTPANTNNELERFVAQQHIMAEMQAAAQEAMQPQGVVPPEGGGEGGAPPGGHPGAGRPPSYSAPPRIESKDGGARTTISTSR